MSRIHPPAERVVLGLVAACASITAPMILFGPLALLAVPIALFLSAGHAFLLALPAYLLLRRWINVTYPIAALCGFLVGAVPVAIQALLSPQSGWVTSFWDWWDDAWPIALVFGLFGLFGGLIFRRVLGADDGAAAAD